VSMVRWVKLTGVVTRVISPVINGGRDLPEFCKSSSVDLLEVTA
jgi:hypothetical protein